MAPLHEAVLNGNLTVVKLLVEGGADVNAQSDYLTPLLTACGSVETIDCRQCKPCRYQSVLLEEGKRHNRNPYYHQAIAEYLIENGADINSHDSAGRSSLDLSCEAGNYQLVKLLLDRFAKIKVTGTKTTLHFAIDGGNPQIVQLIMDRRDSNGDRDQVIHNPHYHWNEASVNMAVRRIWNHPNVCQIVEILILSGMDVNFSPNFKTMSSPLHHVCMNPASPLELLRLLLKYGADVNIIYYTGNTLVTPLNYVLGRFLNPFDLGNTLSEYEKEKINIILDHVSNMKSKNQNINPMNTMMIEHYQNIQSELKLMKTPISKLNGFSVFDVITKNMDIAGRILENKDINKILSSLVKRLPFYGDSLNHKIAKIRSRRLVFLSARNVFAEHIFSCKFPLEIVEKCCMFLSTNDLKNLSKVVKVEG